MTTRLQEVIDEGRWSLNGATTGSTAFVAWSDSSTLTAMPNYTGLQTQLIRNSRNRGEIGVSLYFRWLRSKAVVTTTPEQRKRIRLRLKRVQKLLEGAKELGQEALWEASARELLALVRIQELAGLGYDRFILNEHIERFRLTVRDRAVKRSPLSEFPRPIPAEQQALIKKAVDGKLFDRIDIVYADYTGEQLKSTATKIKDKDPICFGWFESDPERLFFICDWIDDKCDLTFDRLVDQIGLDREATLIDDPDQTDIDQIKRVVYEKMKRLEQTNVNSWRDRYREELESIRPADVVPEPDPAVKVSFWARLKKFIVETF